MKMENTAEIVRMYSKHMGDDPDHDLHLMFNELLNAFDDAKGDRATFIASLMHGGYYVNWYEGVLDENESEDEPVDCWLEIALNEQASHAKNFELARRRYEQGMFANAIVYQRRACQAHARFRNAMKKYQRWT